MQITDFSGLRPYLVGSPSFPLSREVVMLRNVGGIDRALRIVIGIALLAWLAFGQGDVRWWGLLGFVFLGTGLFGRCPLYVPFGIRTGRAH